MVKQLTAEGDDLEWEEGVRKEEDFGKEEGFGEEESDVELKEDIGEEEREIRCWRRGKIGRGNGDLGSDKVALHDSNIVISCLEAAMHALKH